MQHFQYFFYENKIFKEMKNELHSKFMDEKNILSKNILERYVAKSHNGLFKITQCKYIIEICGKIINVYIEGEAFISVFSPFERGKILGPT